MSKIRWKIGANAYMTINTDGFNSVKVTSVEFSGSGDCYSNNDYWDDGDREIKYILDYWEDIQGQPSPDYMDSMGSGFFGGLPYVETTEKPYEHFELFDYSDISRITIPSAITSIGACLLYWTDPYGYGPGPRNDCTFDIVIKGSVTKVGYNGICNCTSGNIVFESDALTRLDKDALSGNLGQINLGQCIINTLSVNAFAECKNAVNLNIKEITCIIGAGTFSNCYSLKIFSTMQVPDGSGGYKTVNNYILTGMDISKLYIGDPFWCCQSLEEITVGDNATIEKTDESVSYPSTFFCFIHSRNEYPPGEVPIWPQYWTQWEPPLPPYVSKPDSGGLQTTKLITNNQTYKNIDWEFYGRTLSDGIWYIAHKGQWLVFNPQEVTDNNCIIMKHNGQYIKYKLVLPSDPKASPVYCKHNNRWMCLAYN